MNTPTMESPPTPQPQVPQTPQTPQTPRVPRARAAEPPAETTDASWRPLYLIGGVAALLSVMLIVAAMAVFLVWPPPSGVSAWFALFQRNGFLGLLDLDLAMIATYVVMIPIYLALFIALRRVSQSLMAIALALNLIAVALIFAANPGVAMWTLSSNYAAATTGAEQATYLAAGQALLANWSGTGFVVGYLLGGIAVLITSAVMLRSKIFSKLIAYTGLVMGVLMLVPASAGTLGLWISLVSLAPTALWLVLVGMKLMQLGNSLASGGESFVVAHPRGRRRMRAAT